MGKKKKKSAKSVKNLDRKTTDRPKFGSSHRSLADIFKRKKEKK